MEKKSEKDKEDHSLDCIYGLIGELSREKPDAKTLKSLCSAAGITYEVDLVQLMSKVLVRASCSPISNSKSKKTLISEA